jgi:hypothetical protein
VQLPIRLLNDEPKGTSFKPDGLGIFATLHRHGRKILIRAGDSPGTARGKLTGRPTQAHNLRR